MRKLVIVCCLIFIGIFIFPILIDASKGGGEESYHAICSAGDCYLKVGGGNYNCDPTLHGVTPDPDVPYDNPCCKKSSCQGLICKTVNYDHSSPVNAGFTCPGQYKCHSNVDCNPCSRGVCNVQPTDPCQTLPSTCSATDNTHYTCTYTKLPFGTGCGSGKICNLGGVCCTIDCGGKECGSNSCDGSCGTCDYGNCNSSQQCHNDVYWNNLLGIKINETYLNNTVKLTFSGHDLTGEKIDYEIREKTTNKLIWNGSLNAQSPGLGYITWKAISGVYYFKAMVNGTKKTRWFSTEENIDVNYRYLNVSTTEINSRPIANITNPKYGEVYFKRVNISFNQSSYDIDDYINYTWNLDDLKIYKGSTIDYTNYNVTDNYNIVGQKNINLSVIDERGLTDQDHTSILVIDPNAVGSKYVFAGIKKPNYGEVISAIGDVEFDASYSYAIQVGLSGSLVCIGGKCPATISGASSYDGTTHFGDFSIFNFSWRFDDSTESGMISGNPRYNKGFLAGDHFAVLEVSLDPENKSSSIVIFKYTGGVPENCQEGGTKWVDTFTGISYFTSQPNGKCLGPDGLPETSDDCCPKDGHTCQGDSSNAKCTISSDCVPIPPCNNYTDPSICANDKCGSGQKGCTLSSPGGNICGAESSGGIVGCNCFWNSSAGTSGQCQQNKTISINIEGISIKGTGVVDNLSYGECSDGQMVLSQHCSKTWNYTNDFKTYLTSKLNYTATPETWLDNNCKINDCFSGTRMVACDDNSIRLGFFNWINAIIALIVIAGVYFIWSYINKTKNKKAKKKGNKHKF